MAVQLMRRIRDTESLATLDKFLLMTLATYGKADGTEIIPGLNMNFKTSGIDLLAKNMGVHERTVRRCLERLVEAGLLEKTEVYRIQETNYGGQLRMYKIILK